MPEQFTEQKCPQTSGKTRQKLIIEIAQRKASKLSHNEIWNIIYKEFFVNYQTPVRTGIIKCDSSKLSLEIVQNMESIGFSNTAEEPPKDISDVVLYVYRINENGPLIETLESDDANEPTPGALHWILPARDFHGLWESLYYDEPVKQKLIRFAETSMLFAQRNVDTNLVSCNRLILLHGPPGTGKTSLCKALAQKLSIRFAKTYRFTHLIEINSHSLFSKWFSESGKLVARLFDDIKKVLQHKESLVCLLIDEVESIAFARNAVSSNEPSDSLRVVNAVLTQLDQIRHFPNLLVLTTSNITSSIDSAFLDRADIQQYIGPPAANAIYNMFVAAVQELIKAKFISWEYSDLHTYEEAIKLAGLGHSVYSSILHLASECIGLSGRILKKIPFLAHTQYASNDDPIPLVDFIGFMLSAARQHIESIAITRLQNVNGNGVALENGYMLEQRTK